MNPLYEVTVGRGEDIRQVISDFILAHDWEEVFIVGAVGSVIDTAYNAPIDNSIPMNLAVTEVPGAAEVVSFTGEVMEMYTRQLARRLGFSQLAKRLDFCVQGVRVNSARGRWGSCSKEGVIHYSFRIAFLPTALVEYIAVHELCHTVCFDHSPAFWAQVESCLPDWKELRSALKAKSSLMNLL